MKKRILSIAAMVAAMLFAASCSKDDDTQNAPAPAPSTTENTEPTGQKSETIAVPFSITVNQGNNSLTKAKLVEDGDKLVQKFVKGDELVITGEGLSTAEGEESVLKLDENDIDKESATFSGILYFVSTGEVEPNPPTPEKVIIAKEGIKVDPHIIVVDDPSITLTATLRNESDENWNKGVKLSDPVVVPSSNEVNAEYMFTHYGYLKAEFKYKEGVKPTITLRQYTVLLEFDLDFTGAKVNVQMPEKSDPYTITLGKDVTYVAVPDGAVVTSQMIDNGESWTIDLDEDYENNKSATVWYYIERTTPDNCIPALFSVSDKKQVFFSKGNLQYNPNPGANKSHWRFAKHQFDYIGKDNENISETYEGFINLFGWGMWLEDQKTLQTEDVSDGYLPSITSGCFTTSSAIGSEWKTLTGGEGKNGEWYYLINSRGNGKYGLANICDKNGLIILPDEWNLPNDFSFTPGTNGWTTNIYTSKDWEELEANGAVFLPAAGFRGGDGLDDIGYAGRYWSSYGFNASLACRLSFSSSKVDANNEGDRYGGYSVRLVRPL